LPLNKAILLSPDRLVWGKVEPGPTPSGFGQQSAPPNWVSATVATCYVAPAGSAGPAGPGTETGIPPFPPGSAVRRVPTPAYLVSVTPVTVQSSLLGAGRMVQLLATNYVVTLGSGSLLSMTWTDVYQMVAPTSGLVTFPGVIVATGRVPLSPPPVNSTWEAEVAKRLTGAPGAGAPLDLELRVEGITVATRSMRFNAQFPGSPAVF
jgi:hypothetical protein